MAAGVLKNKCWQKLDAEGGRARGVALLHENAGGYRLAGN